MTRGVIDYLVSRTENPDSSRALLTLSETKWGHLMQLQSAELVRGNQYYGAVRLSWIEFSSISHQRATKSLSKKPTQNCNKVAQAPEKYRKSNRRSGTVRSRKCADRTSTRHLFAEGKSISGRKNEEDQRINWVDN